MKDPQVTVLMSVYNAGRFLREAVDSVLNQTFNDFEFIIFDDKSADGSLEILKNYHDERIILIENTENMGLTRNLAKGMDVAGGKYVARMDADDVCLPKRFEEQVSFLDRNLNISIVGSSVIFFNECGREFIAYQPVSHDEIKCFLFYSFAMLHPSVMMRRQDFLNYGLNYDPYFHCSQDHDLWTRAVRKLCFANIYEPLIMMREHSAKIGHAQRSIQESMSDEIRRRQLDELGVDYSAEELEAFNLVSREVVMDKPAHFRHYESILLKIFQSNRTKGVFDQSFLQRIGANFFRSQCRSSLIAGHKCGRYYWRSPIRPYDACNLRQKAGLLIRTIYSHISRKH